MSVFKNLSAPIYFWVDGALVTRYIDDDMVTNVPCVDDRCSDGEFRIGLYEEDRGDLIWRPAKPSDLPPEFRAHLLILGVAT